MTRATGSLAADAPSAPGASLSNGQHDEDATARRSGGGTGTKTSRRAWRTSRGSAEWTWWDTSGLAGASGSPATEWTWWPDGQSPEQPNRARKTNLRLILTRFAPYALQRRGSLALLLFLALLPAAIESLEIWLFKVVVDDVLVPKNFDPFPLIAAAYLGLTLLGSAVSSARRLLSTWLSQRFLVELRVDLLRHLQTLSLDFFSRSRMGDLLSRMTSDVAAIEQFVLSAVTGFVTALLQVLFFTAALFYLHWQLALVALTITPSFWLISRRVSRKLKDLSRQRQKLSGQITSVVEQGLSNLAVVQAYGQEEAHVQRFRNAVEQKNRVEMSSARLKSVYGPLAEVLELVAVLLVIGTGTWLATRGQISVGGLLAFLTYLTSLLGPIRSLGTVVNAAYSASAGAERVLELLDEQPVVESGHRHIGRASRLGVEAATFRYPGASAATLTDVSFEVAPGETVALVGESGAGKSTLAKLLVRFYDPDSGRVLLDGEDIRSLTLESLRRNVSVLLQEALVFDGTIGENIRYGRAEATADEVVEAAKAAGAHDFISALPDGYQTRVGERGRRLSGGQCQRIAIARALLRNAPILLLDEPTTGLDANAVDNVLEPLRRLMARRSTIVISHNLITVRDAHRIVVLHQGRVVEVGSHDELLARGGHYAQLWRRSRLDSEPDGREVLAPVRALPVGSTPRPRAARVG